MPTGRSAGVGFTADRLFEVLGPAASRLIIFLILMVNQAFPGPACYFLHNIHDTATETIRSYNPRATQGCPSDQLKLYIFRIPLKRGQKCPPPSNTLEHAYLTALRIRAMGQKTSRKLVKIVENEENERGQKHRTCCSRAGHEMSKLVVKMFTHHMPAMLLKSIGMCDLKLSKLLFDLN